MLYAMPFCKPFLAHFSPLREEGFQRFCPKKRSTRLDTGCAEGERNILFFMPRSRLGRAAESGMVGGGDYGLKLESS